MANNGDITYIDIEAFLALGHDFPETSTTTLTQSDVDEICTNINADVNLILERLGFELPVTGTNSVEWLELTKKFGAASLVIDSLGAQNSEEENTRATRFWTRYTQRLDDLISSGGEILTDAPVQTDPMPSRVPTVYGQRVSSRRKRYLRFPQRAAADQYDDENAVRSTRAGWKSSIRGW